MSYADWWQEREDQARAGEASLDATRGIMRLKGLSVGLNSTTCTSLLNQGKCYMVS